MAKTIVDLWNKAKEIADKGLDGLDKLVEVDVEAAGIKAEQDLVHQKALLKHQIEERKGIKVGSDRDMIEIEDGSKEN